MTTALVNSTGQIGFKNAQHAFEFWFEKIAEFGDLCQDTLALRNIGFYIMNPLDNNITGVNGILSTLKGNGIGT